MTVEKRRVQKLKPAWMQTDIPKKIKVKLWRLMRDNTTYHSWEHAIVGSSGTSEQDKTFSAKECEYIKMSKATYKALKEELMLMPQVEIKTLPEDLQEWIFQLRPELKATTVTPQAQPKLTPYSETPHKLAIRKEAIALADSIKLPFIGYCFLPELTPGMRFYLKGGPSVVVPQEGEVEMEINVPAELHEHLSSGGLQSVMTEIQNWLQLAGKAIMKSHEFLTFLGQHLEEEYSIRVQVPDSGLPGPTPDFLVFICADAVERSRGSVHFRDFKYSEDEKGLRFGASLIYRRAEDESGLERIEEMHRQLRARCAAWKRPHDIAADLSNLNNLQGSIVQKLRDFARMEHLPGQCKLCSYCTESAKMG